MVVPRSQANLNFSYRSSPVRVQLQAALNNAPERLRYALRQVAVIWRRGLGNGYVLRQSGSQGHSHGPNVTCRGDDAGCSFGSIIDIAPPALAVLLVHGRRLV